MTNTGKQIANLIVDNGKTAADMTHAIKVLGGGNMQQGFARIEAYYSEEIATASTKGLVTGRIQGIFIGIGVTAIVGGTIFHTLSQKHKRETHELEGQQILQVMESSTHTENNM